MQSECDCETPLSKSIQNKRFRVYRPHGEASPSTLNSPVPYASPQRPPLVLDAVSPKSETVIRRHEGRDSSDPVALETCQRVLLKNTPRTCPERPRPTHWKIRERELYSLSFRALSARSDKTRATSLTTRCIDGDCGATTSAEDDSTGRA